MDNGLLSLPIASDLAPYWDVTTTPGGSTYQNMTGWAMQFVIRKSADNGLVFSTTSISIGNGLGTGSRATVTIADTDIVGWPAGNHYYGTLWRTDNGSDTPVWTGPVHLLRTATQV